MRISRRFSRSAAAGAASALAALSMAACSGSSSGSGSAASGAAASQSLANANANENDVQVLNSLQLTTQELDSAFATDNKLAAVAGADPSKILLKQAWACTQNIIDTKQKSLEPVTTLLPRGLAAQRPGVDADRADRADLDVVLRRTTAPATRAPPPPRPRSASGVLLGGRRREPGALGGQHRDRLSER